jgi:hypothetical protein
MKEAANWAASSATETLLTQLLPMCGTMIFRLHGYGHYGQSNGQSNANSPNVEPHGGSPLDWTATLKHTIADFVPIAARLLNFLHLRSRRRQSCRVFALPAFSGCHFLPLQLVTRQKVRKARASNRFTLSPALAYCETGLSFESSYRFTFSSPAGLLKVCPALKSGNLTHASKSTLWTNRIG